MQSVPIRDALPVIAVLLCAILVGGMQAHSAPQAPAVRSVDERILRGYAGVYQWESNAFLYIQMWSEFTGKNQLVAFDESGEVRTLYPIDDGRFSAGPGAAVPTAIESRIDFQRNGQGKLISLTWRKGDASPRTARRVEIETREDVAFSNGEIRLAGTLISTTTAGKHRDYSRARLRGGGSRVRASLCPLSDSPRSGDPRVRQTGRRRLNGRLEHGRFRRSDGRCIGGFRVLEDRNDIEHKQIGLLGVSHAGWVMPIAAIRGKDIAFLISVSGAGVSRAETTIDEAEREMAAGGLRPEANPADLRTHEASVRIRAYRPRVG